MKSLRRKSVSVTNSRWAAYATAGAATALAGANSAEANIHYVSVNQAFNAGPNGVFVQTFALDNAGVLRFRQSQNSAGTLGAAFFRIQGAAASNQFRGSATGNFRYPSHLAAGVPVSGGAFVAHNGAAFATLAFGGGYTNSHWLSAGTGFIGFRFNGGSGIEYGWARVTMNSGSPLNTFTVVDYAWGDVGTPITTGQTAVPEPGSLGLLALGATGLLVWRRSRAKAA